MEYFVFPYHQSQVVHSRCNPITKHLRFLEKSTINKINHHKTLYIDIAHNNALHLFFSRPKFLRTIKGIKGIKPIKPI